MREISKLCMLLILTTLCLSSCDNGDDEPIENSYKTPTIATRSPIVLVPAALIESQDPYAQIAGSYMEMANGLASYSTMFTIPGDAQTGTSKGAETIYFWTYAGYSYWMSFTEESNRYIWEYDYETPEQPRFTYIRADEQKDGKAGNWTISNPENLTQSLWSFDWVINADGDFAATLVLNSDNSDTYTFEMLDKADKSGGFVTKIEGTKVIDINWTDNGNHGTWWVSFDDDIHQGSW